MLYHMGTRKRVWAWLGAVLLLGAAVLAQKSFAQYGESGAPKRGSETLEGVITDSMCGASHGSKDAAKCTMACVNGGKGWALAVGDKVYTLEGRMAGISSLAGKKAKVTGRVTGNEINVTSVEAAD